MNNYIGLLFYFFRSMENTFPPPLTLQAHKGSGLPGHTGIAEPMRILLRTCLVIFWSMELILQCCVNSWYIALWLIYTHTHISFFRSFSVIVITKNISSPLQFIQSGSQLMVMGFICSYVYMLILKLLIYPSPWLSLCNHGSICFMYQSQQEWNHKVLCGSMKLNYRLSY